MLLSTTDSPSETMSAASAMVDVAKSSASQDDGDAWGIPLPSSAPLLDEEDEDAREMVRELEELRAEERQRQASLNESEDDEPTTEGGDAQSMLDTSTFF